MMQGTGYNFRCKLYTYTRHNTYGFRLKSPDTLVAIGEAAWSSKDPFSYGEEWNINNIENKDHYYRYFTLAFKVELRA
jgi:hypothetical protein